MLQRSLGRARARRSDEGFTLIELLIVIIILGVLAAIVVFSVSGISDKGNTAACQTTQSEIDTAYEAYVAQGGTGSAAATLVSSLGAYFHGGTAPTKAGTHDLTGLHVSEADAITC